MPGILLFLEIFQQILLFETGKVLSVSTNPSSLTHILMICSVREYKFISSTHKIIEKTDQ